MHIDDALHIPANLYSLVQTTAPAKSPFHTNMHMKQGPVG